MGRWEGGRVGRWEGGGDGGEALFGRHQQRRRLVRRQHGQRMLPKCQRRIGPSQNPLMPQMHAVEKTDGQLHRRAASNTGNTRALKAIASSWTRSMNGMASATANLPHLTRRSSSIAAPHPSACPRSRASARADTPFAHYSSNDTNGGSNAVTANRYTCTRRSPSSLPDFTTSQLGRPAMRTAENAGGVW